jgi:hypothetical protein
VDHEKRKWIRTSTAGFETYRQLRIGDMAGDSRWTSTGWENTAIVPAQNYIEVSDTEGLIPTGGEGSWIYFTQTTAPALLGFKMLVSGVEDMGGGTLRFYFANNNQVVRLGNLGFVVGDQFVFSPVYARATGANVSLIDERFGSPLSSSNFRQVRAITSVGGAFSDVSGYPLDDGIRTKDNHFNGLVYEGTAVAPTVRAQSLDDEGNLFDGVQDGESKFYAGFGSADADVMGKYGIKGTSLSPGLEIICPDLDYRLLEMLCRGTIQGTERGSIGRST